MTRLCSSPPWRVLIFPGGTEIGLEINRALRDCKEVELLSAGQSVPSAAEFRFRTHLTLPLIDRPECADALADAIDAHAIDAVFPAHDDVVLGLARLAPRLNAAVITSPRQTCEICRSKTATYQALASVVPVPRVFTTIEEARFPLFVKPDRGQGSARARRIDSRQELQLALHLEPDLVASEYLPGEEYTIDCFSDRNAGLLYHSPRVRTRTRAGISMQSRAVHDPRLSAMAIAIGGRLKLHGAWFFQARIDLHGEPRLLEVAPRISGTMALSRVRGVNFPLLSLFEAAGVALQVSGIDGEIEISRSLDNHYKTNIVYPAVYIDLDDTLILREKVNERLIRFIFQCINRGIPVRLLTRHRGDLPKILQRHRLAGLFDEIIHVGLDHPKHTMIREPDAIFIDDSFRERYAATQSCGVRSLDPASVECLLDDRV